MWGGGGGGRGGGGVGRGVGGGVVRVGGWRGGGGPLANGNGFFFASGHGPHLGWGSTLMGNVAVGKKNRGRWQEARKVANGHSCFAHGHVPHLGELGAKNHFGHQHWWPLAKKLYIYISMYI